MFSGDKKFGIRNIAFIGMSVALISICSWISIPSTIPFTLQTFAILLTLYLLGGRDGMISILTYIILGVVGVPVFSNFGGGAGVIMGPTGGYILGFILLGGVYWLLLALLKRKLLVLVLVTLLGMVLCYSFGTIWFSYVYSEGSVTFWQALKICVIPFIIPDLVKMALALFIDNRLRKIFSK